MKSCLMCVCVLWICFGSLEASDAKLNDWAETEKAVRNAIQKANPEWICNSESFGLSKMRNGLLFLYLKGEQIKDLSALSSYSFDGVWLIHTKLDNVDFLQNSEALSFFLILREERETSFDAKALKGKKLQKLSLLYAVPKNPDVLYDMPLHEIYISGVRNVDFDKFTNLSELKTVKIREIDELDLHFLHSCKKLSFVDFSDTKVNDLSPLPKKTYEAIVLRNTPIEKKPYPDGISIQEAKEMSILQ